MSRSIGPASLADILVRQCPRRVCQECVETTDATACDGRGCLQGSLKAEDPAPFEAGPRAGNRRRRLASGDSLHCDLSEEAPLDGERVVAARRREREVEAVHDQIGVVRIDEERHARPGDRRPGRVTSEMERAAEVRAVFAEGLLDIDSR